MNFTQAGLYSKFLPPVFLKYGCTLFYFYAVIFLLQVSN